VFPDGNETLSQGGLTVGDTYYVRVYGYAGATGTFDICVIGSAGGGLANDDCDGATPLTVGAFGSCPGNAVAGDLTTATTSMLAGPSCMIDGLTDVFYSFNSGSNTSLMFN